MNTSISESSRTSPSAAFDARAHLRFWIVATAALALDLWSKHWAFSEMAPSEIRVAIPSILTFRRSLNAGALFGMGQGMVPLFVVASLVALAFVVYLFACSDARRRSLHVALSFVLAGTLGNLYDRTMIKSDRITLRSPVDGRTSTLLGKVLTGDDGSRFVEIGSGPDGLEPKRYARDAIVGWSEVGVVRDFLKIEPQLLGRDVWPWIFNVADSLLVCGVCLLMINFWLERRHNLGSEPPDSESDSTG